MPVAGSQRERRPVSRRCGDGRQAGSAVKQSFGALR